MERAYKQGATYSDGGFVWEYAQKYKYDKYSQTEFYLHQLMHFFIQTCISLLSYIKIT